MALNKRIKTNEAAGDDSAMNQLTIQNTLSNIFGGGLNGLRIPSALKAGCNPPNWDSKYLTYPFVGFNGCSLNPPIKAKKGSERGAVRYKLNKNKTVLDDAFAEKASTEFALLPDIIVFSPKTVISKVGTGADGMTKNSVTPFVSRKDEDKYLMSISPYHLQQVISKSSDGNLVVDPHKSSSTVILKIPITGEMCYVDKLTDEDVFRIGGGGNAEFIKHYLLGSNPNEPSGPVLGTWMSIYMARRKEDDFFKTKIPETRKNRSYCHFTEFLKNNGFTDYAKKHGVENNPASIKKCFRDFFDWWITENANNETVMTDFFKRYLIPSDFNSTYCLRSTDDASMKDDIDIFNMMFTSEGQINTQIIEEPENSENSELEYEDGVTEAASPKTVSGISASERIIDICRRFAKSPVRKNPTSTFITDDYYNKYKSTRGNGEELVKSEGQKITFARILGDVIEPIALDVKVMAFAHNLGDLSGWVKLDYSQIFEQFGDIVDENAKKVFDAVKIVGYMMTFTYDPKMIEISKKAQGSGKVTNKNLLNAYFEYGDRVDKPTIFDLMYIKNDGDDFIFSGYDINAVSGSHDTQVPDCIVNSGLLQNDIGSRIYNDYNFIKGISAYNSNYH